jgi:hypothetical protein
LATGLRIGQQRVFQVAVVGHQRGHFRMPLVPLLLLRIGVLLGQCLGPAVRRIPVWYGVRARGHAARFPVGAEGQQVDLGHRM